MTFIIVFQVKPLQAVLQVLQYKVQLPANLLFQVKDKADATEIFMKTNSKSHNQLTRTGLSSKVKLWPKCNQGFFCECTQVKPLYKSIITTKEALLRFTVSLFFWVKLNFNGSATGTLYVSIRITIFKTLRRFNTT